MYQYVDLKHGACQARRAATGSAADRSRIAMAAACLLADCTAVVQMAQVSHMQ